jgi:hypothetical protein
LAHQQIRKKKIGQWEKIKKNAVRTLPSICPLFWRWGALGGSSSGGSDSTLGVLGTAGVASVRFLAVRRWMCFKFWTFPAYFRKTVSTGTWKGQKRDTKEKMRWDLEQIVFEFPLFRFHFVKAIEIQLSVES